MLVDLTVAVCDGATWMSTCGCCATSLPSSEVASRSTAWRSLEATDDATLERIAPARAKDRRAARENWMDPGSYVIDIDGTLVDSYSEKERVATDSTAVAIANRSG